MTTVDSSVAQATKAKALMAAMMDIRKVLIPAGYFIVSYRYLRAQ
jgi:hypothetical protein